MKPRSVHISHTLYFVYLLAAARAAAATVAIGDNSGMTMYTVIKRKGSLRGGEGIVSEIFAFSPPLSY